MLGKHTNLEVAGLTESSDVAAIDAFRADTGAAYPILHGVSAATKESYGVTSFPILHGVSAATKESYGVTSFPSLRVVDAAGRRAGDDMPALEKALGP